MSDVYVSMHKHAGLPRSGGTLPEENLKFDTLRLLLRLFGTKPEP